MVTDLDGTLLDHHTYSCEPAQQQIQRLKNRGIPLIFNTSKSRPEVEELRAHLGNTDPFIVENGSAIYFPGTSGWTALMQYPHMDIATRDNYTRVTLGTVRATILQKTASIFKRFDDECQGFSRMNLEHIMEITGLAENDAAQAADREFSEPVHWFGSRENKSNFIEEVQTTGLKVLEGGRFLHILGNTNKGIATAFLRSVFQNQFAQPEKTCRAIVSGDGNNDVDMLNAADLAIVVRSPVNPIPVINNPNTIITKHCGPQGWANAIAEAIP